MSRAARPRPRSLTPPTRALSSPSQCDIAFSGAASTPPPIAKRPSAISHVPRRGLSRTCLASLLAGGKDADDAAATASRKAHRAGSPRVKRVIFANAHARARLETGTALAHDDLPTRHRLARKSLHAQPLRV